MKRPILILICALTLTLALAIPVNGAEASSQAGLVEVAWGSLNVRSGASATAGVMAQLPKGSYVTLLSASGDWWRVEYRKGQYGYCHKDYITAVASEKARVEVSSSLNVRSGPGTGYEKTASLYAGETVLVLSRSGTWSRILFHGTKTGYVSSQYLSGSSGSSGVSLNVPRYLQTDSRWAGVKLGSSGQTMAKIGCATTGIAMMESHRTGTTVTPDAMAAKLRYTASGSVYWPSHYTAVTSSDSLNAILKLLQAGKPVLYGAKNAYGSQHWVVITGFTGGTVTAANFTINDPGSASRTTLAQFLKDYPTFYKYFTY